jgi:hypothetical protein
VRGPSSGKVGPAPLLDDAPDLAAESPAGTDVSMDFQVGDGDWLGHNPATPVGAPGTPPAAPPPPPDFYIASCTEFMPRGLTVPGLQHIANNLCCDTHTALEGWKRFWVQCKTLEALLALSERRSRYIWTCLNGTPFQGKVFMKLEGPASTLLMIN